MIPLPTLPPLTVTGRELMETLWLRNSPATTRQLHDAIGRAYPERSERKLNTTSTLLGELVAVGWVAGDKGGSGRWKWKPTVSRSEGLQQLALIAVGDFGERARDPWFLVYAALGAVLDRRSASRPAAA